MVQLDKVGLLSFLLNSTLSVSVLFMWHRLHERSFTLFDA